MSIFTVRTPKCPYCGEHGTVDVEHEAWVEWNKPSVDSRGMALPPRYKFVQDAFPQLSADEREMLISGTHSACWDDLFCTCRIDDGECDVHDG